MTTDISKIRESLKKCEEISLPYEFSKIHGLNISLLRVKI